MALPWHIADLDPLRMNYLWINSSVELYTELFERVALPHMRTPVSFRTQDGNQGYAYIKSNHIKSYQIKSYHIISNQIKTLDWRGRDPRAPYHWEWGSSTRRWLGVCI